MASNNGVFFSDASTSFTVWSELAAGLPNGLAYDLDYDPLDDVLVVGTMGRGAWLLPDAGDVINGPASDFGDAPDSYGTTLAGSGPRHTAVGPVLGSLLISLGLARTYFIPYSSRARLTNSLKPFP